MDEIFDFFGKAVCHQIADRTFLASGRVLSVCARDTGIYLGIFSTLTYLCLFKKRPSMTIPSVKISMILLIFMLPLMIDGLGSYLHLFESSNLKRIVTGISFGMVLPYFLYPLLNVKAIESTSTPVITHSLDVLIPLVLSSALGGLVFFGVLPYLMIDGLIIVTIIGWFSLIASFVFSKIIIKSIKWAFSIMGSILFLTFLSILHQILIKG
ncbi:DUF2085 domain-containing protein [Neobacillus sp. LXY-1]|uniref:DUF2085 domain-containing protein n=1 Tax=Neobacillus sp. LXY-1 TaxID=3379133 RepID=UPI003EE1EBC3